MATKKSGANGRAAGKAGRKAGSKAARRPVNSRRRLRPAARERGLAGTEIALPREHAELVDLVKQVEAAGGAAIGAYRDPLGGRALLLAALPLKAVQPTPFQRDLSPTHTKRLAEKIEQAGVFLDPLIVVRGQDGLFWTPNGRHRLAAAKVLGLRQVTTLICPDETLAFRILALNTEKAHNLREKALEVIRIYRGLIDEDAQRAESGFAFYLEEASLVTLGICYEKNGKFAGGAYNPVVRRLIEFSAAPLAQAVKEHEKHAAMLMDLDERVAEVIAKLKARGFVSPYLRAFVVARINPLRWIQGDPPPLEEVLKTMRERAAKFNVEKVKQEDLASVGGAADE
jgi:ParB family chromosome partitioning protein